MKPDEPPLDPALPTTVSPSGRVVYDPLQARRVEVDAPAAADVGKLLGELRALENGDAREVVPEPVALVPTSDGALITAEGQDAAAAHVEAKIPEAAASAHIDSAPVKIADPRRLPTTRIEKKSPWIPPAEPAGVPIEREAGLPSSPSSAIVGTKSGSSRWPVAIGVVVMVATGALFALRSSGVDPRDGGTTTAATGDAVPTLRATAVAPAPSTSDEPTTEASITASAPSTLSLSAPMSSVTAPPSATSSPASTGSAIQPRVVPSATSFAIATASPVVPSATVMPTVAPAVSSVPSSKPSSAPPPSDTTFVIQPKGITP